MLRHLPKLLILGALALPGIAQAKIPKDMVKIGVLQDLPGPFSAETGNGGIVAAQMAAAAYETEHVHGDAEILPHVSQGGVQDDLEKVREWLDVEHVAAVVSSAPAVVNARIARMVAKRHVTLLVAATDAEMGGAKCSPNAVVWGAGPDGRARALAKALASQAGKQWFIVAAQDSASLAEQKALQQAVSADGGKVVGTLEHPIGEADMRKAQPKIEESGAQVLALVETGPDLIAALRSVKLSGLSHRVTVVAPWASIGDVDAAGPAVAAGVLVPAPFYWDADAQTVRFALKWSSRMLDQPVTENSAEVYAAVLSFLHAAKAADDVSAEKVLAELRRAPIKHTMFGTVSVRKDGRVVYDMSVYQVKQPNQVQNRWAYYTRFANVPGTQAFPPSECQGK